MSSSSVGLNQCKATCSISVMHNWGQRNRHALGYGSAWDRLRAVVLRRDGYLCQCAVCKSTGRVRLASQVDHIIPKAKGGTDALSNLQAIHAECHVIKSMIDQGATPRKRIGVDGWPLEMRATVPVVRGRRPGGECS